MNAKYQSETFIVRAPPPFHAGEVTVAPTGFALERQHDLLGEPQWRTLVDLDRVQALELEGALEGVTAVGLVVLPLERPARLRLVPDRELAALLERAYWDGTLLLPNGRIGPLVFEELIQGSRHVLERLEAGHAWG
ncbi:MAG: hypothetical protein H6741_08845 [Alphaproteobacteria bacterium]|nr:hypothetical protein [Alphaproteobacteria bacterium]MCB9792821.1 hypothetical protein [Alphaproteobacteria bacterium]